MGKTGTEKEHLVATTSRDRRNMSAAVVDQESEWHPEKASSNEQETRQLSTFFGVVVPCVLSMFSVILFLRMGFIVGQAGLTQSIIILFLSYIIIGLTVLSVCAISTNGAIEGGGAYFMISRALGPEFGGAIGLMFFLANVASAAMYVFGIVEAMTAYFGPQGELTPGIFPQGTWYEFGYGSAVLFVCFVICLVGANIYAKTTFIIFLVVMISVITVIASFFAKRPFDFHFRESNNLAVCNHTNVTYTGFNRTTLEKNMPYGYSTDYTTGHVQTFVSVFAVFFNGCIGINAGANMSGELKNPSKAIPVGTILACVITWFIYLILMVLIAASTPRDILQCSYTFLVSINVWSPFVVIGIFASTTSAILSQIIGGSRILLALARDEIFGILLRPVTKTSQAGNPYVAVTVTWLLIQILLFARNMNTIAPIVTIFFLFAYAAVDMSCLALDWASAPNFRPTFKYFSWHTCLMGIISCVVMMFLIQPIYASVSTVVLIVLVIVIHYRVPTSSWGYVSQALIFHQVRKYLLMLDVRKEHVKFWRPQILLMVKNPRTCCEMIDFINSIKKSGLYVLGHVSPGRLSDMSRDILQAQYLHWTNLVSELGVKAFVELTLCPSVREGTEHLLRLSGLGGMKPNTLVLGFYDDSPPSNSFDKLRVFKPRTDARSESQTADMPYPGLPHSQSANYFPSIDDTQSPDDVMENKSLAAQEYVEIIADAIKLRKNVCIGRHFKQCGLPESTSSHFDITSVFLMQMGCILNMTQFWKKNSKLRITLCTDNEVSNCDIEEELNEFLRTVRIKAEIRRVQWKYASLMYPPNSTMTGGIQCQAASPDFAFQAAKDHHSVHIPTIGDDDDSVNQYLLDVNNLIKSNTDNSAVTFLYLPAPPSDESLYTDYLRMLTVLSQDLGPTLYIHGLSHVVSTTL